jgi:glucosamine 6-phosphate synthetase-like amidotransferase/phosphosugar isomerase protein
MCGIVTYLGPNNGVRRVQDALTLLTYRAPDATGIAVLGDMGGAEKGRFAIRRVVGDSQQLQAELVHNPLPLAISPIVVGHGRWAMVGANSVTNAHPLTDRSRTRLVVENGSHNATLMLNARAEQTAWWHQRGLPPHEPIHRSTNTTEVIAYEWERMAHQLVAEGQPPAGSDTFRARLDQNGIVDPEERALRLALWRLREGNGHACALYSAQRPFTLYVSSHHKSITLATRIDTGEMMVASDVNAALVLWSAKEAEMAVQTNSPLTLSVIHLDYSLHDGTELLAKLSLSPADPHAPPQVSLSRYDGQPITAPGQLLSLNPEMIEKQSYSSYTEHHIAEIPDVLDRLADHYLRQGQPHLESIWQEGQPHTPGLNIDQLTERFGSRLDNLHRLHLVGEGSSWRDALCATPLLRRLLPGIELVVSRPVAMLNVATAVNPQHDLAILISWSGTTDALLKVDGWLTNEGLLRLSVTGRPQSDLGRRTIHSGGTINVLTGVETAVATTKGFVAILYTLNLLTLQLASLHSPPDSAWHQYRRHLQQIPTLTRQLLSDDDWRRRIRETAQRGRRFNKVVVVGLSPVNVEGELKIEELAQIVAIALPPEASLRPLIERTTLALQDEQRILFVLNASTATAEIAVTPLLDHLRERGALTLLLHSAASKQFSLASEHASIHYFPIPSLTAECQPLLDALFFFELAVGLAYARGLSPAEIDRPRNLAKSVTTTGAERYSELHGRAPLPLPDATHFDLDALPLLLTGLQTHKQLATRITADLTPLWQRGYDKWQIIGGGQDYAAAHMIARSLRQQGIMAEAHYTDSAWHGPLAAVGGPDADHDALVLVLALDPLFQATALVDTQVYRVRNAPVFLVVPQGYEADEAVQGVAALGVWGVTAVPRPFTYLVGAALGKLLARLHSA